MFLDDEESLEGIIPPDHSPQNLVEKLQINRHTYPNVLSWDLYGASSNRDIFEFAFVPPEDEPIEITLIEIFDNLPRFLPLSQLTTLYFAPRYDDLAPPELHGPFSELLERCPNLREVTIRDSDASFPVLLTVTATKYLCPHLQKLMLPQCYMEDEDLLQLVESRTVGLEERGSLHGPVQRLQYLDISDGPHAIITGEEYPAEVIARLKMLVPKVVYRSRKEREVEDPTNGQ